MVMRELHEGPLGSHFAIEIMQKDNWMQDISGQLYTKM